ncbi:TetR family transcriptional regulator [Caenispirillum bisanense]|uniref:TetR family transcriptional regulator n=1 Tax=Caenispirillum bisanense TaxID=414052 RepID=UPI0031CF2DA0
MARKTKAEAELTRDAILDAAEAIFFEKGVARTTLDEISRAAGVTRGALYWHFRNKADVLTALIHRVESPIDHLLADIAEADAGERDLLDRTRQVFRRVFEELAEDTQRQRVFTILIQGTELVGEMQPVQDHFDAKGQRLVAEIRRVLERCRASGELPPEVDPALASSAVHAFVIGIHMLALRCGGPLDLRCDAPAMIDMFFAGLARGRLPRPENHTEIA